MNRTRIRDFLLVSLIINTGCRNSAVLNIRLNEAPLEPKTSNDRIGINLLNRFFYPNENHKNLIWRESGEVRRIRRYCIIKGFIEA